MTQALPSASAPPTALETPAQPSTPDAPQRWALVGSPNSGKSTLFNQLTGLRAKVANYPGVTVEWAQGRVKLSEKVSIELLDLPGTYSFDPLSPEEKITVDILAARLPACPAPSGILFLSDATSLARTLPLLGQLLAQTSLPVVLVLTMIDELKARGGQIRVSALQAEIGIPILGIVGNKGLGVGDLKALLLDSQRHLRRSPKTPIPTAVEERFAWADALLASTYQPPSKGTLWTDRLDRLLLHPILGLVLFVLVMNFFFQAIFQGAEPLKALLERGIGWLSAFLSATLPVGLVQRLLVDGILAGVGSVLVFLPQIALLFLLLSLLEQSGYMSRAVFLIDRIMGWIGLDGRCFVSLLSSYACAIPGILATRSIPDPKHRLVTILVAPLMTCSARLPVYTLLIAAFVPPLSLGGGFQLQGLVMFALYLAGGITAFLGAFLLRRGPLRGHVLPFYIELPPYRFPTFKTLSRQIAQPIFSFLTRAGTVILAVSILLWFLLHFPTLEPPPSVARQGEEASKSWQVERSYAGNLGKTIEPLLAPIGFDWQIAIGLIAGLAAREVIVASLGQIFATKTSREDTKALSHTLPKRLAPPYRPPHAVQPHERLAVAFSLLVFFIFALQCVSTLAVMRRETGSWRYPALAFGVMFLLAYAASFLTFRLTLLLAA